MALTCPPGAWTAAAGGEVLAVPQNLQEPWAERVVIMVTDGGLVQSQGTSLGIAERGPKLPLPTGEGTWEHGQEGRVRPH